MGNCRFLFLTICTVSNLIFWLTTLAAPALRRQFVSKYLELSENPPHAQRDAKSLNRSPLLPFLWGLEPRTS